MRDRYSIVVGLLFLADPGLPGSTPSAAVAAKTRSGSTASRRRWPLPEFAVPAAAGSSEGDANVAQDDCELHRALPGRRSPRARLPDLDAGAIRVCDLFDRPLVISFWFTKGGDCADQQDVVEGLPGATVDG